MRRTFLLICILLSGIPCLGAWVFDGAPSKWEGIPDELKADEYTYPVLVLELGGPWTDFELRASTNNFENLDGLVYYICSWGPTACPDDTNVWIYFVDDYGTNQLAWRKSVYGSSILSQLADQTNSEVSAVVVSPSHDCVVDWRKWMASTNDSLTWSFLRFDGLGPQSNATGTKLHHSLTVPVQWRRARLAP